MRKKEKEVNSKEQGQKNTLTRYLPTAGAGRKNDDADIFEERTGKKKKRKKRKEKKKNIRLKILIIRKTFI